MKIKNGFAPIGLTDKYNTGASVTDFEEFENMKKIVSSGKGEFAFYSKEKPKKVTVNKKEINAKFENSFVTFTIEDNMQSEIIVSY